MLITVSGQARNSKNTTADILVEVLSQKTGEHWGRKAFADPVKEIFCQTFGVTPDFVEKWKVIDEPPPGFLLPVRKALQFIGNGFRQIDSECWINLAFKELNTNCVISDGRYLNEARATAVRGGLNVLVWRPGYENDDPNPSENEIFGVVKLCLDSNQDGLIKLDGNYHYFLRNDGSKQDLRDKICDKLVDFILSR